MALRQGRRAARRSPGRFRDAAACLDPAFGDQPGTAPRRCGSRRPPFCQPRRGRLAGDGGIDAQPCERRAQPRRVNHHNADSRVPVARDRQAGSARLVRQIAPDARRLVARAPLEQGPDPRGLSQPRTVSRRDARGGRGRAGIVRQKSGQARSAGGGASHRAAARSPCAAARAGRAGLPATPSGRLPGVGRTG